MKFSQIAVLLVSRNVELLKLVPALTQVVLKDVFVKKVISSTGMDSSVSLKFNAILKVFSLLK